MNAGRSTPPPSGSLAQRVPARWLPLAGIVVGAVGGAVYWLAATLWPSNVAVVLAMSATALLTQESRDLGGGHAHSLVATLFTVLIKYNALMALSSAKLSFALPENVVLGLVMAAACAASYACAVSVMAPPRTVWSAQVAAAAPATSGSRASHRSRTTNGSLAVALSLGFAPAVLLGLPGLIGVAAALLMRLALTRSLLAQPAAAGPGQGQADWVRQLTEAGFLLGALAGWKYV